MIDQLWDFLWLVLTAPKWFLAVMAMCAVTVWMAYGLRALTAPSAWAMLGLFFVWVAASNSWHFIPKPGIEIDGIWLRSSDPEAWRLWSVYLRETLIVAYLAAAAVSLGVMAWLIWGAYTQTVRFTMLTALYGFMVFIAQAGEVMQRHVCSTNSPDLGNEYKFWAQGQSHEACARLFEKLFGEGFGTFIGPLFFPIITVIPPLILLGITLHKWKGRPV